MILIFYLLTLDFTNIYLEKKYYFLKTNSLTIKDVMVLSIWSGSYTLRILGEGLEFKFRPRWCVRNHDFQYISHIDITLSISNINQ